MDDLSTFFNRVTGQQILPYQSRYGAAPFEHTLLSVPTGLGKTDAVLVPWLHRVANRDEAAPRRLAFVLPRANLTEQVANVARSRVQRAGLDVAVLELMGGSSDNDVTIAPDRHAILVGTQDILVSRALNRGYARKPFRWPLDFGLLNNDCLWIFDEVQLMSDSLATSAQLAAFRARFGVFGSVPCTWMSATLKPEWLETVDFAPMAAGLRRVQLEEDDYAEDTVRKRVNAPKTLARAPEECRMPAGCADFVLHQHRAAEMSLVITNTVARAREIAAEIRKSSGIEVVLLHSRFRPADRARAVEKLGRIPQEGQIVVSTQVIEAGIDLSAHRLITDAAPWSSLVQRFGRVNRYGEMENSWIWWVDLPLSSKTLKAKRPQDVWAPYDSTDVERAMELAAAVETAAPAELPQASGAAPWHHVLRRADLLDLFDTSPDLALNEIDISRFVRSGEERDCYIAWREWEGDAPADDMPRIEDIELCPAPIGEAREFAKKTIVFVWNFLARAWQQVEPDRWYPGMVAVVRCDRGGYTSEEGWSPGVKQKVTAVHGESADPEAAFGGDRKSWVSYQQTLRDHIEMVVGAMKELVDGMPNLGLKEFREELTLAAAKHDWGKAHDIMQQTLHNSDTWTELLAKQERGKAGRAHKRKHFRHELGSALAMIESGDSELATYLVAAHHGRVRVTLRSMPNEYDEGRRRTARGIRDGDRLPACELTASLSVPEVTLNLEPMELGAGERDAASWTERVIRLRDRLGPFKLAYLEMLLRVADEQASAEAGARQRA